MLTHEGAPSIHFSLRRQSRRSQQKGLDLVSSPHFALASERRAPTALLVIPGRTNYFYNLYGQWMAEALRAVGVRVDCVELSEVPARTYDVAILSNLAEIEYVVGEEMCQTRLAGLRQRVGTVVNFTAECLQTRWFHANLALSVKSGIAVILDVGFLRQDPTPVESAGLRYHFAFDGLLGSQVSAGGGPQENQGCRTIPWAVIGAHSQRRVELADRLLAGVSPQGVIYLPELSPVTSKGSAHLNQGHIDRILRKTEYYVWGSHHDHFYVESLRFRMAYLAGCVPIKVVPEGERLPDDLPMRPSVLPEEEMVDYLRDMPFAEARRVFREEYEGRPRLEEGLASLLQFVGLPIPNNSRRECMPRFANQPAGRH